jgi:acyl-CoA thioester hydrolase
LFKTTRRVEFRDTDAAGIMHFSVFFTAMEAAEQAFLRSRGLSVLLHDDGGELAWPRVAAKCDYQSPLKFDDVYEIALTIVRIGSRSVTFGFDFTHDGRAIAKGEMTSVCCRFSEAKIPSATPVPDWIVSKLRNDPPA